MLLEMKKKMMRRKFSKVLQCVKLEEKKNLINLFGYTGK